MTPKQFIEKAIEGGWKPKGWNKKSNYKCIDKGCAIFQYEDITFSVPFEVILLDLKAWQAVGKSLGWEKFSCSDCYSSKGFDFDECLNCLGQRGRTEMQTWEVKMHQMIDALAEGNSIKEFLKTLSV